MANTTIIPGIGESSQELLEVAGFLEIEALSKAGVDPLVAALEKANSILKISKSAPSRDEVEGWVNTAREMSGLPPLGEIPVEEEGPADESGEDTPPAQMPVDYEQNTEVSDMLEAAPCAIPLPAKVMMENRLAVSDIPPAILLNRYSGDLEVRVSDRLSKPKEAKPAVTRETATPKNGVAANPPKTSGGHVQRSEPDGSRLDIDTSRVKNFEKYSEAPQQRKTRNKQADERVALLRAPREETNRGKNPNSRWYIKGVLHTNPFSLAIGAVITLLLMVVLPAAIVAAGLLFVSDQFPGTLPWVPKWILVFPLALPVLGFLYLSFGLGGKCRICGQRLFWPRHCRKNSKAHHVPLIGHIVPTALHMLTFKWFRCIYCGTPVRLKK